jgi:hypothetical protein
MALLPGWSCTAHTANWYSAWLPNSEAANRKPVFRTQMDMHGGSVSKYFTLTSVTVFSL